MTSAFSRTLLLLVLLVSCSFSSLAQRTLIRLILKDGSYQMATKYEIQGDRVHYFSAERSAWEDVPVTMVDWDAMKKWQEDHADHPRPASTPEIVKPPDAEEKARLAKQEIVSPEVAAGIRLPESGGTFIYDIYRDKPELIELPANGSEVNPQRAKNVLRATVNPLARPHESIELTGAHARIQVHIPDPAIFLYLDTEGAPITPAMQSEAESRFRIVRVSVTNKAKRIVGVAKLGSSGQVSEKENFIATKSEVYHGGSWLRITPVAPLAPGQYALVEMVGKNQINIDSIFDFGVYAAAPDNLRRPQNQGSGATEDSTMQEQPQPKPTLKPTQRPPI